MASVATRNETRIKEDAVLVEFRELKSVSDDLQRALAQEKAMARTLIDTIHRIDSEGEKLRKQARA